jgi:glucose-1-phosphate thymidylyltransferase
VITLGTRWLVVGVGYIKEQIINHYRNECQGIRISDTQQCEQKQIAHAPLTVEDHINDDSMSIL